MDIICLHYIRAHLLLWHRLCYSFSWKVKTIRSVARFRRKQWSCGVWGVGGFDNGNLPVQAVQSTINISVIQRDSAATICREENLLTTPPGFFSLRPKIQCVMPVQVWQTSCCLLSQRVVIRQTHDWLIT